MTQCDSELLRLFEKKPVSISLLYSYIHVFIVLGIHNAGNLKISLWSGPEETSQIHPFGVSHTEFTRGRSVCVVCVLNCELIRVCSYSNRATVYITYTFSPFPVKDLRRSLPRAELPQDPGPCAPEPAPLPGNLAASPAQAAFYIHVARCVPGPVELPAKLVDSV